MGLLGIEVHEAIHIKNERGTFSIRDVIKVVQVSTDFQTLTVSIVVERVIEIDVIIELVILLVVNDLFLGINIVSALIDGISSHFLRKIYLK